MPFNDAIKSSGDARSLALSVLGILFAKKETTLDVVIENAEPRLSQLSKRDRAFFNALVYGVIRFRAHLDYIIQFLSAAPFSKIDPLVINALRLGIFQLKFMDRVPESAAVNTSVNLVKTAKLPLWVVKFTNGVLRNAIRKMNDIPFPDRSKDPVGHLSRSHAFPEWLVRKWIKRLGLSPTENLLKSLNDIPPMTLRVNTLKTNRAHLLEILNKDGCKAVPTPFSQDGIITCGHDAVTGYPGYPEGLFQVQDEAAQLISCFLDPKPGEIILDACAGLGGKTAHIAALMKDQGKIYAVDREAKRLVKLKQEIARLDIHSIEIACMDMVSGMGPRHHGMFDKILVDAPCSGLGVIRRNPDIKWHPAKENLLPYHHRQIELLEAVKPLVKPGGIIVYAVCSMEPEENDRVIENFLGNNPTFEKVLFEDKSAPLFPLIQKEGYLVTLPSPSPMDGFFAARLRRASAT